jgi:hypothetical protein
MDEEQVLQGSLNSKIIRFDTGLISNAYPAVRNSFEKSAISFSMAISSEN